MELTPLSGIILVYAAPGLCPMKPLILLSCTNFTSPQRPERQGHIIQCAQPLAARPHRVEERGLYALQLTEPYLIAVCLFMAR